MYKMKEFNLERKSRFENEKLLGKEENAELLRKEEGVIQRYCKSWIMVYIALCSTCTIILLAIVLVMLFLEKLGLSAPTQSST